MICPLTWRMFCTHERWTPMVAQAAVAHLIPNGWKVELRVRITRNLTGVVDGIQLHRFHKNEVYEVGSMLGCYLLACRYAEPVDDATAATRMSPSERVWTLREYLDASPHISVARRHGRRVPSLTPPIRPFRCVQFIVAANRRDLLSTLRRDVGTSPVEIIVDRRRLERRLSDQAGIAHHRRHGDRRVHDIGVFLQSVGFAMNVVS